MSLSNTPFDQANSGPLARVAVASAAAPQFFEGQFVYSSTDLAGALRTSNSAGSAGYADEAAFAEGVTVLTPAGGAFNDSLAAIASGKLAMARITAYRALHTNLRNSSGVEIGTLSNALRIDPVGTTPQPVTGTVTVTPPASNTSTAPAQTAVSNTASIILAANASRKRFTVQNTGTTAVYVALGGTSPTVTAYTFALPACGSADDGSSPAYSDMLWTGAVRAICAVSGTCVITEMT